jgi:peptidoglycan/LPS O-acetylase OafA/YrhL
MGVPGPAAAAQPVYRPLGFFRFSLAILVLVQHGQHLLPPGHRLIVSHLGLTAVAVFFAVSGFVVTEVNAVFYQGRPLAFFTNRLLRLVPPYAAALALSVLVHAVLWEGGLLALPHHLMPGDPLTARRLLAGVFGLVPALPTLLPGDRFEFIPFAWSLRLEMAFYLAFAAALLAASHIKRWPVLPLCAALAMSISLPMLLLLRPWMFTATPMFFTGIAVWLVLRHGGVRAWCCLAAMLAASCLGYVCWVGPAEPALATQLLILVCLIGVFAVLAARRAALRWQRLDRFLGDLSYPLYLNHYVVIILLTDVTAYRGAKLWAAAFALSTVLAVVMGQLVDGPLRAVRARLRHAVL